MAETRDDTLKSQIRQARSKFIAMAVTYSLGVFNDNFFRQAGCLLAVVAGRLWFQGWATALFALPYLLVAAPAGWMADRFRKRHIVILAKVLELAAMLCGAVAICMSNWTLMLAMVGLMGLQSSLFNPSLNGSIPELYPASYVITANARLKMATTGAILLGFALAGVALSQKGAILGVSRGQFLVAGGVVVMALLGFLSSFGVPRRQAAAPGAKFPRSGPLNSLVELWHIRKDRLLALAIGANVFVFFVGQVQILVINVLGVEQFGLTKTVISGLLFAELFGLAMGGLLSSRIARGRYWYRVLSPAALGMAVVMGGVAHVTLLPDSWQVGALFLLLGVTGLLGGMMLIPCDAFIQVRPAPERKGTVIAAGSFAVFSGILLSGPVAVGLLTWLEPTMCFALLAALALLVGLGLALLLPVRPGNPIDMLVLGLARLLLWLRYRIKVIGLDQVAAQGTRGILFLPNHPALIDPPIMLATLCGRFAPRTWADQDQIDRPIIRTLARRFRVRAVPGVSRHGADSRDSVAKALQTCVEDLRNGDCVLLYPAGRTYKTHLEDLRGNTAVHTILRQFPDVRIVLARTRGLWGSRFSWASGQAPRVGETLKKGAVSLVLSGIFFAPRRQVTIEFVEPDDLPRTADRETLNHYLENFYNQAALPSTYVPYTRWEKGGARALPDPFIGAHPGDVQLVPEATGEVVIKHLRDVAGVKEIRDEHHLARDLGLDSLARTELVVWLGKEFGFPQGTSDTLLTVADVLLAACGETVAAELAELKPVSAKWFRRGRQERRLTLAEGNTVTEAFLSAARRAPGRAVIADQTAGVKTYRDIITAVLVLKPEIEKLSAERVGIMLPASVVADIVYLATLFAGKTPVMVNWTVGPRNVVHSLELVGVKHILTAKRLVKRIASQGTDLSALSDRFVFLEELGKSISLPKKLAAWVRARLSWQSLEMVKVPETAVILFTSGSESLPKAVPLTHANVLTNVSDVCQVLTFGENDSMIGILPPFHSFGLTGTVLMALCAGVPTVYHPDPTEAGMLARLIEAYQVSLLVGTPTFLMGIVRASTSERLATLRLAITGAEKCSARVYEALARRSPQMVILEGYGVTECAPIISVNNEDDARRGTIGKVLPSLTYAIVDVDSGKRVGRHEQGMLLVRGPSVFDGYLGSEGESPFIEFAGREWYRTGDLVSEDETGVLTFHGRLKRFAKLGGEMISLPAIEAVLEEHYTAAEDEGPVIAVEVTPDEEHPEIVLFTTCDIDRETVNEQIREAGLSALHNIRRVIQVEEIPVLGTGKTDYRALRYSLAKDGP